MTHLSQRAVAIRLVGLLLLIIVVLVLLSLLIGSTGETHVRNLFDEAVSRQIVWDIRLPRALGAGLAGGLLGLAGSLAQGLFRNPLADPYLLGSASGASLGVALALLGASHATVVSGLSLREATGSWLLTLGLTGAAFTGAMLAVLLTLFLARGVHNSMRLLLAGVVVGVVLGAVTSLVLLLAPEALQSMQAFMLGSTSYLDRSACLLMAVVWLLCMILSWLLSPVLDGLALGESTAASLGLPLLPMRAVLVGVLALATGTAVAQTGLIAFVGLAAPHLVRAFIKTTHGWLLLLSSLMGCVLLLSADVLARWLIAPLELPVGVVTAVLGGGYLLWLMQRADPVKNHGTRW